MAIPSAVPAMLGTLAVLTTIALLAIYVILAQSLSSTTTTIVRVTAVISATLQTGCLVLLSWLLVTHVLTAARQWSAKSSSIWVGAMLLVSVIATALSVATLVCFSAVSQNNADNVLGSSPSNFLLGASVVLGLSFAMQLIFILAHCVVARGHDRSSPESPAMVQESHLTTQRGPLKAIPYSQTTQGSRLGRGKTSLDALSSSPSTSGRSATETMSTIRSSLSNVVRPTAGKLRLASGSQRSENSQRSSSQRSLMRPPSLDSASWREPAPTADGFDTWDTSAVDPQNRQTVLETSSPTPARFLETIPASPTTSRSPSPGTPLDLEPPRTRRRSRSYSPASTIRTVRPQRSGVSLNSQASEAHIHPLFRSDSPAPPNVTPGTVVTAAPNAGQIISDRQSIRSLTRMRSGSLPATSSPLSRQSSFDDFGRKRDASSPDNSFSESAEDSLEEETAESERTMTPPIPDWILSAGSRKSLARYDSRKHKDQESEQVESS